MPGDDPSTTIDLGHGASADVDDGRLLVRLPANYAALSSAVLNGGLRDGGSPGTAAGHVLNCRVPASYDGLDPSPEGLLREFAEDDGIDPAGTVGLLTAASMESLSVAHREAQGVRVSALVTAGISNARRAGADADFLGLCEDDDGEDDDGADSAGGRDEKIPYGTINTVVVVSAPLSEEALVECYAIIVEAKCAACDSCKIMCRKDPSSAAQGTGTDCAVLACPARRPGGGRKYVKYAGKHTLFAEMVGQAVGEATESALSKNVEHVYGSYAWYAACRWTRAAAWALRGTRPCVPPRPLMPMPGLPLPVAAVGAAAVVAAYLLPGLPGRARLLLAAFAWDRWLGEPPLAVHPVVVAGRLVKGAVARVPAGVLGSPALGLLSGLAFLLGMLILFGSASWTFLAAVELASSSSSSEAVLFPLWAVQVVLLKSTFSIQLLCTVSLQMARFLERKQVRSYAVRGAAARHLIIELTNPANFADRRSAFAALLALQQRLRELGRRGASRGHPRVAGREPVGRARRPPVLVLLLRAGRSAALQGGEHAGLDGRVQRQVRVVRQTVGASGRRDQSRSGKDNVNTADYRSWHLGLRGHEERVQSCVD